MDWHLCSASSYHLFYHQLIIYCLYPINQRNTNNSNCQCQYKCHHRITTVIRNCSTSTSEKHTNDHTDKPLDRIVDSHSGETVATEPFNPMHPLCIIPTRLSTSKQHTEQKHHRYSRQCTWIGNQGIMYICMPKRYAAIATTSNKHKGT